MATVLNDSFIVDELDQSTDEIQAVHASEEIIELFSRFEIEGSEIKINDFVFAMAEVARESSKPWGEVLEMVKAKLVELGLISYDISVTHPRFNMIRDVASLIVEE